MRIEGAIVRAVEAALTIAVVVGVVCCVKFGWLQAVTDAVADEWVAQTAPLLEGEAVTYVVPRVSVPDRLEPLVEPFPERPSATPTPTPAPTPVA